MAKTVYEGEIGLEDHTQKNVVNCWRKRFTGLKLCATAPNNIQKGVKTDAACDTLQCYIGREFSAVSSELHRLP